LIPTTLVGLLLFVVLMTPGFVYQLRLERTLALGRESALREVLRIIVASLTCSALSLAVAAILRVRRPGATPDVGELVRRPHDYVVENYRLVGGWALMLLGIACLIGFVAADPRLRRFGARPAVQRPLRWLLGSSPTDIDPNSAWYRLMHLYDDLDPPLRIYVGCELDDGSYVSGELYSVSTQPEETADRDLVIMGPILHRSEDGALEELDVGFSVISARRIIRLDFSHLDPTTPLPTVPAEAPPVAGKLRRALRELRN
jgi:hypothetical protein